MKLKELKPGMEVAVGNPLMADLYCTRAIVIGVGWKRIKPHFMSERGRITNDPGDRGVAVATVSVSNEGNEYWNPHICPASHVIHTWPEYLKQRAMLEKSDKKLKAERAKEAEKRDSIIKEITKLLGISAYFSHGVLCISEDNLPKMLEKLQRFNKE